MNNIKNNTLSQGTGYFTVGGLQICYGQNNVSKSGNTVTYPKAFKAGAQPRIVATVVDTNQWIAWVKPTPNNVNFILVQSYADASLPVNWIAIAEAP